MKLLAVLCSFLFVTSAGAKEALHRLSIAPGGKLWLEGDSTFHRYKANATEFSVEVDASEEGDLAALIRDGKIKNVVVDVPVQKLKSGESGLDDNMYKALLASAQPVIVFTLESYKENERSDKAMSLTAHGHLKLAEVERSLDIPILATPTATGMRLTGEVSLLMSEYRVKAPVFALVMKTKDKVTVKFEVELLNAAHYAVRPGG